MTRVFLFLIFTNASKSSIFTDPSQILVSMLQAPKLLLVGGNTRHIGKTTLICEIITAFSKVMPITALKVSSIYKNDTPHHGKHDFPALHDFEITKETGFLNQKDTAKMLKYGALESYFIRAYEGAVEQSWNKLLRMIPARHLLVCESRSLRRFIEPGLFIYLKISKVEMEKPDSLWLESQADKILLDPEAQELARLPEDLTIDRGKWRIRGT